MWEVDTGVGGRETYVLSFPRVLTSVACPVEVFPDRSHTLVKLWGCLMYRQCKTQLEIMKGVCNPCRGAETVACTCTC